jgi:hypothetical protein
MKVASEKYGMDGELVFMASSGNQINCRRGGARLKHALCAVQLTRKNNRGSRERKAHFKALFTVRVVAVRDHSVRK